MHIHPQLFAAKIALESATNEIGSMEIQLKQEKEESEQLHALNCGVLNEKHQKAIDAVQAQGMDHYAYASIYQYNGLFVGREMEGACIY